MMTFLYCHAVSRGPDRDAGLRPAMSVSKTRLCSDSPRKLFHHLTTWTGHCHDGAPSCPAEQNPRDVVVGAAAGLMESDDPCALCLPLKSVAEGVH